MHNKCKCKLFTLLYTQCKIFCSTHSVKFYTQVCCETTFWRIEPTVVSKWALSCPKVTSKLSQSCQKYVKICPKIVQKLPQSCPKIVLKLSSFCIKVVLKLSKSCPRVVSKLFSFCIKVVLKLYKSCPKVVSKLSLVVLKCCCPCSLQVVPSDLPVVLCGNQPLSMQFHAKWSLSCPKWYPCPK